MTTRDTLNTLLSASASKYPKRTALVLVNDNGEETVLTYRDLQRKVRQAAAAFQSRGIKKGDTVAIIHRNDPAFVVAYFGLARLGAVAVPINYMVKKAAELRFMLEHCEAKGVLTQQEFLRGIMEAKKDLPGLRGVWSSDGGEQTEDFWEFIAAQKPLEAGEGVLPEDVAAVLYTSGTTGVPKGVMLTHANLVSNADASITAMRLRENEVALTVLPMFHTFAWTACVLIPLRLGVKNVVIPSLTPPKPWLKAMGRHRVTIFAAVPQLYAVLARQACGLKGLLLKYWFFRKVRIAVSGAAPLSKQTLEEFRAGFGMSIIEGYGLTETSPVATINPLEDPRAESVGLPIDGVQVRIVDEGGKTLPEGGEGEIQIRGSNIMKGYLKNPEATREAIDADGWFKTGDVGALEQGYLYIRDRIKDMIIVKGLKVFSAQVEAVMLRHPDVQEAAVIGIPGDSGDETIKGYVVLRAGAAAGKSEILSFCRENLDPYKRPRDIDILDELPKNALQKTLKRVLREQEKAKKT
ncbi:MAG: long-chain-fatty-acid--CoA ligase [Elusimicrobiota bacterium]